MPHRPTLDLDLLGYGDPAVQAVVKVFRWLAQMPTAEDGLAFDVESVTGEEIREQGVYPGVRVHLRAHLGKAVIPLQVDVGFGDLVTPGPVVLHYPSLLGLAAPMLRAYPPETVVAEKLESLVLLGMKTSRMKDIYDLWCVARSRSFVFGDLHRAVKATFNARGTTLPASPSLAFTSEFSQDEGKRVMWKAFLSRSRLEGPDSLEEAVLEIGRFLQPVMTGSGGEGNYWPSGGPWQERG
jgi:Nucleotidyl transferase AbiEii toxin, Type IV TA system